MRYQKWLTSIALTLVLIMTASIACAQPLRVGVDTAFVPFEYKGEDGKYTGFDVDLLDAIANRVGVEYELMPMDFNGLIPGLTTGNLDVAIAAIFIKSSRKRPLTSRTRTSVQVSRSWSVPKIPTSTVLLI